MTAAKHALAEGDFKVAAQRLVYARDADPRNPAVLRLLTIAFWEAGNLPAAGRAVRDWARAEPERPAPHRYAARIYEDMRALSMAVDSAVRETAARAQRRLGVGAARPPAPAHLRPRRRARRARARALDRAERAGAARPRARREPDGRHRRRGHAPASRRRSSRPTPPPRGRGSRTRSRAPTARASASPPATARWRCSTTPRSATCASRSRPRSRERSKPRPKDLAAVDEVRLRAVRGLGAALRLLPVLLPAHGGEVEEVVRAAGHLGAARVGRVGVEDVVALAQEEARPGHLPRARPS